MQARITFYQIKRCGIYKRGSKGSQPQFLGIKSMLANLENWAIGKELSETDVFKNAQNKGFCTYLADIKSTAKSTILVMWNQVPHTESGVLSLPNKSKVGAIKQADANAVKEDSIPGYPTYFWFVPSKNVFATICFSTIVNGRIAMENYVKQFMAVFSDYVVKEFDEQRGELVIKGYSADPNDEDERIYSYRPSFVSAMYPKTQELQFLKEKAPEIKKITKTATATYRNKLSLNILQKFMGFFSGLPREAFSTEEFTVKGEVSVNGLTKDEIQSLYDEWESDVNELHSLDYGFKINGEQYWFSRALAKWEGDLSLSFTEQNSFGNIESLLLELEKKRTNILSILSSNDTIR
ncbi:MAG: hypothetical protein Q4A60_06525 [Pasteurellaceae bacterium]|nr:hypothetical protein [Pasteurellaceae bacterium]